MAACTVTMVTVVSRTETFNYVFMNDESHIMYIVNIQFPYLFSLLKYFIFI